MADGYFDESIFIKAQHEMTIGTFKPLFFTVMKNRQAILKSFRGSVTPQVPTTADSIGA